MTEQNTSAQKETLTNKAKKEIAALEKKKNKLDNEKQKTIERDKKRIERLEKKAIENEKNMKMVIGEAIVSHLNELKIMDEKQYKDELIKFKAIFKEKVTNAFDIESLKSKGLM
jgi:hypothetical protein